MRKAAIITALLVLCAAYWAWPYVGLYGLAQAAERHDSAAVAERVDFRAVRRSVARQIVAAYLDQSGRGQKMGAFQRGVATAVGTTVADPYLEQLLSPQALTTLLGEGRINPVDVEGRAISFDRPLPSLPDALGRQVSAVVLQSYFDGWRSFVFHVPGERDGSPYGIHVRLDGTTWRLSGVDLPQTVVDRIASDIVTKEKTARPS